MNIDQVSDEKILERVRELVASVEWYARLIRGSRMSDRDDLDDLIQLQVTLTTELATLLGKGRLEVSRES